MKALVMAGWGCVHEQDEICTRVANRPCDPGMKGCILAGRYRFSNETKNRPPKSGAVSSQETRSGAEISPSEPPPWDTGD